MSKIDLKKIKELRNLTQLSIGECRKALEEAKGDLKKALEVLKKHSATVSENKASRSTRSGFIASYVHTNGKIGSLVVLNCETDFVAKNEDFRKLAYELAVQVAGYNPLFIDSQSINKEQIKQLEKEFSKDIDPKKPAEIKQKIIAGRLKKYLEENSLMEEPYFRDESIKVKDLVNQYIHKLGENIKISKFVRLEI